jgi:hypothetical protein
MEVIYWYILFAITTSATAMYELYVPVMQTLKKNNPDNNIIQYKWITYFTFFMFSTLLAPLMLPACIIPSFGDRFRKALLNSLSQI